jgi:hypothetical protein
MESDDVQTEIERMNFMLQEEERKRKQYKVRIFYLCATLKRKTNKKTCLPVCFSEFLII